MDTCKPGFIILTTNWLLANPSLCLLNDDSGLCISSIQNRMLFAGFTAAKKTIIQNWFTPHMCGKTYWIHSLLQIVTCECTTAWINGAKPSTIDAWQCFFFNIRDYIKEWLVLCFSCPSLSSSLLGEGWRLSLGLALSSMVSWTEYRAVPCLSISVMTNSRKGLAWWWIWQC